MSEQLKGTSSTWELASRTDAAVDRDRGPSTERSRRFHGPEEALDMLRSFDADALNATALRSAMAMVDGVRDLSALDADEANRMAAWMLEDRTLLEHRHRVEVVGGGGDEADDANESGEPPDNQTETWIEVHLKRLDGTPISGEAYKVKLPDGTVQEGTTNAAGAVRIEHIIPGGICDWSFPDLDRRLAVRNGAS